ncbi:hypothetical protein D1007_48626 [Hordeum vulgare]|nr:hypothetical protein D1007_48626 [Hordeum vulgare]
MDAEVDHGIYEDNQVKRHVWASLYSSETREWTSPVRIRVGRTTKAFMAESASVLVGQALYVLFDHGFRLADHRTNNANYGVLKYDLGTHCLSSVVDLPELCDSNPLLISSDDGGLGVVRLEEHGLCLIWSMEVSPHGAVSWIQLRKLDLKMLLLPVGSPIASSIRSVGFVEGTNMIIVATNLGEFTIDLQSLMLRKFSSKKHECVFESVKPMLLYTSFNNPPVAGVADDARSSEA